MQGGNNLYALVMGTRRCFGTFLGSGLSLLLPECAHPAPSGPQPPLTTATEFCRLMETVARGWNTNNARLAADCFAEGALYSAPPDPKIRRGKKELFEFFGGLSGRPRPMQMTWHHLAFDPPRQIGFGEYTFTYKERTHGIVVVHIVDRHIANWREYEHVSPLSWEQLVGENKF